MAQAWLVSQLGTHGRHAGPLGVFANMHDAHMAAFQKDLVLRSVDDAYGYPSSITDESTAFIRHGTLFTSFQHARSRSICLSIQLPLEAFYKSQSNQAPTTFKTQQDATCTFWRQTLRDT